MKTNKIILAVTLLVIVGAIAYTFTASEESPEDYIEKIEKEREKQYRFIRYHAESPLTEKQKQDLGQLVFYDIDPGYKVKARLVPIQNKKIREVPMSNGTKERYIEHSFAEFPLGGKTNKLLLLQSISESDARSFFLAFADETSGKETYGGGRYLNLRQDGSNSVTIDFNLAYNPYCAYNPDYACPLPPRENLLQIPIKAGEKNYKK